MVFVIKLAASVVGKNGIRLVMPQRNLQTSMASRKRRLRVVSSPVWECHECIEQFFGATRCPVHNPTPEQRDAHPDEYMRDRILPNVRDEKTRQELVPETVDNVIE